MLVRQLLRRCGHGAPRRWPSARKRSTLSHGEAVQTVSAERFVVRSHVPDVDIPSVTIPEFIWAKLDKWRDHTAVICSSTGRLYTYAELRTKSRNLAKALRVVLGLPRGATIGILLPNVPEFPIAILGAMEAGIIVTTVNPIYTADEIGRQLQDSDARAVITLVEGHATAQTACNGRLPIITIKTAQQQTIPNGAINFADLCEKESEKAKDIGYGSPDDVAVMPYSSGTTGLPKGVELTHRNIVSNMKQASMFDGSIVQETSGNYQDIVSCVLPMFHIYGMSVNTFKMMSLGAKLVTMPRFTPETYVDMLTNYKPEHLFVVPPIVIFLAAHPMVVPKHLDNVRSIVSGAAPLGASDVERFFEKTNREIVTMQGYGMTETSPGITMTYPDMWKECFGSIGLCMPNTEIKVVSVEDGITTLGPNEKGELLVRGPQVMKGYHNNPKATDEVFQDGWLKTGDMVYYDDKKIVWITDRLKELIKVKGFQVAPAELEAIIRDHPSVADAAVIGVPHPIFGEVPKAYVVPKKEVKIDTKEIQDYVAKDVASYKKLEGGVTVIDAIPKNPSGKIMRRVLRKMYDEEEN